MLLMAYVGPADVGARATARFRALATPIVDMVETMPYPEIYQFTEEAPEIKHEIARSLFADGVDLAGAEAIIERGRSAPNHVGSALWLVVGRVG